MKNAQGFCGKLRPRRIFLFMAALALVLPPEGFGLSPAGSFQSGKKLPARESVSRNLANDATHNEVRLDPRVYPLAAASLLSFKQFMDLALHHPRWGYYNNTQLNGGGIGRDFHTFPISLSPFFGRMVAEHACRLWAEMVRERELRVGERFTLLEFGGGTGEMAFDVLEYVRGKAKTDIAWKYFAHALRYKICERSPVLREKQREKNRPFGPMFESAEGDARQPQAAGKINGLIFSNELIDALGAQKVILNPDGTAEGGLVIPCLSIFFFKELAAELPDPFLRKIEQGDAQLRRDLGLDGKIYCYLTLELFQELMDYLVAKPTPEYEKAVQQVHFAETFVPARFFPGLEAHLQMLSPHWAAEVQALGKSAVVYLNPDAAQFVRGAAEMLQAGCLMTIDYGNCFSVLLERLKQGKGVHQLRTMKNKKQGVAPFDQVTLQDVSTDVLFDELAAAGNRCGLRVEYFGPQKELQTGTPFNLDAVGAEDFRLYQEAIAREEEHLGFIRDWVKGFVKKRADEVEKTEGGGSFSLIEGLIEILPREFREAFPNEHAAELIQYVSQSSFEAIRDAKQAWIRMNLQFPKKMKGSNRDSFLSQLFAEYLENAIMSEFRNLLARTQDREVDDFLDEDRPDNTFGHFNLLVQKKGGTGGLSDPCAVSL